MEEEEAAKVAELSRGAIGRALGFLRDGEDRGPLGQTRFEALRLLSAALSTRPDKRIRAALDFKTVGARGLRDLFNFIEEGLAELARAASGLPLEGNSPEEADFFRKVVANWKVHPASIPPAVEKVDEARGLAAGNINPQLVIFGLLHDLRKELTKNETAS